MNKKEFCELLEQIQPATVKDIVPWIPSYCTDQVYLMARKCIDAGLVQFIWKRSGQEYSVLPAWKERLKNKKNSAQAQ